MKQSFGEKLKALFSKGSSINDDFYDELTDMLVEGDIGAKTAFELVDEWQWVSKAPVKPIEVIEISVKDYWHTISFSEEAKIIQRELYGEEMGRLGLL